MKKQYEERRQIERSLILSSEGFEVPGYCFVCGRDSKFRVDYSYCRVAGNDRIPNWREHLICSSCGLNNRMRAAVHILESRFRPSRRSKIYVTEQTTPLFHVLRNRFRHVQGSEYLGSKLPFGAETAQGVRNESLTKLTFSNNRFDYILSFDVFEHVPNYRDGFAECFRCLKAGGRLIFSVPFNFERETVIRAKAETDGSITHLLPPEYHGDPLNSSGCLCFYHFGWDLFSDLRELGFSHVTALFYWSRKFAYLGNSDQVVFFAEKSLR